MSHVERNDIVDELATYRWYIWDAVYYNWHKPIPSSFNKDFQQQLEYYYFSFIKGLQMEQKIELRQAIYQVKVSKSIRTK
jgi:hypothetical protein